MLTMIVSYFSIDRRPEGAEVHQKGRHIVPVPTVRPLIQRQEQSRTTSQKKV